MYTSRRGFSGGLGYGLPLRFEPKLPGSGLGVFMWSDYRRGLRGLGAGEEVLGPGETLEECPQPVHFTERDELRNEIKGWTSPHAGRHYHENHPDVRAIFEDIVRRLRGLEQRPKLLRCSNEARSRARQWIRQLEELRRRVEKRGTGGPAGCQATTWVHVTEPFQFTVHRGPTYTIRPGSTRPDCFGQGGATPTTPSGPVQSSAPPGSVVVNGVAYPSSAAAAAAQAPGSSMAPPEITSVTPAPTTSGGLFPSFDGFDLEGSIAGIPTKYLVYGGLALVAWRMMKGR